MTFWFGSLYQPQGFSLRIVGKSINVWHPNDPRARATSFRKLKR
jgi:hypothetical protein